VTARRNPEQNEILGAFLDLLAGPTGDGGTKRAAGEKPLWKVDQSHTAAAFRHIGYWAAGEKVDKDSGCHPLAHAAWRLLAVAYQETEADREANPDDAWPNDHRGIEDCANPDCHDCNADEMASSWVPNLTPKPIVPRRSFNALA
jgi:hypothetical protein